MSTAYLFPLGSQIPDKSGCPSGNRGAGAERFGLPSGARGMAEAGTFTHCAYTGALLRTRITINRAILSTFLGNNPVFIFSLAVYWGF